MKKENSIVENRSIKWLAMAGNIISFCEDLMEIHGFNTFYISEDFYEYHSWNDGQVTVHIPQALKNRRLPPPKEGLKISFFSNEPHHAILWRSMYERALEVFINNIIPLLKDKARITDMKHVEYMLLIIPKKVGVLLEGEIDKVRIPFIKAYVMAHTHPSPHCFFSHKDIISSLDIFSNQGLISAVITTTCSAIMYRVDDFTVDDYERLIIISNLIKKDKIKDALLEFNKLNSIKLSFIGAKII